VDGCRKFSLGDEDNALEYLQESCVLILPEKRFIQGCLDAYGITGGLPMSAGFTRVAGNHDGF